MADRERGCRAECQERDWRYSSSSREGGEVLVWVKREGRYSLGLRDEGVQLIASSPNREGSGSREGEELGFRVESRGQTQFRVQRGRGEGRVEVRQGGERPSTV